MSARLWYLRRGVAWLPVLGACAAAGVVALLLERWPGTAVVLGPALLACCAGAASFVFDEDAVQVVAVTPRGAGWRRGARLSMVVLPLVVWVTLVALRPGDLPLARSGWWLLGTAAIALVAAVAALASRRLVPGPGTVLAPAVAVVALGPVVLAGVLGWDTLYPIGPFPDAVRAVWLGVLGLGLAAAGVATRPGLRP